MGQGASRLRAATREDAPACCACGGPIRAGDAHWAGDAQNRAWHYGCAERAGVTLSWNWMRQRLASGVAG